MLYRGIGTGKTLRRPLAAARPTQPGVGGYWHWGKEVTMGMIGYAAMFEQFHPTDLLRYCRQAEDAGFPAVMASDHFHP